MRLTINTNTQATDSSIEGLANNTPAGIPDFYYGDKLNMEIRFSDGEGNIADFQGQADNAIIVGIGTINDRNAMTTTGTFNLADGFYQALIDLDTDEIKTAIGTQPSINLFLEIQISYADNTTETLCQQEIIMRNQIIK